MIDRIWNLIDDCLFYILAVVVLIAAAAITACPALLWRIDGRLATAGRCECRHRDEAGPGPVLPRVLPRVRNLREEAAE